MKKIFVLIALSLLLIANSAFGETDLNGFWCIQQACEGDIGALPSPVSDFVVEISGQTAEGLFEVENCLTGEFCYGVIEKKEVRITCWDNIIVGRETKTGHEFSFISHIQFPASGEAATCIGTATKIPPCSTCDPEFPCICPPTP